MQAEKDVEADRVLAQAWPGDARLDALEQRTIAHLNAIHRNQPDRLTEAEKIAAVEKIVRRGEQAAEKAIAAGFALNPREATVFSALHVTVSTGLRADRPVQRHLYEALDHALDKLTVEDFFRVWGVEKNPSQDNLSHARSMLAHLTQARGFTGAADGRTDMLASFLGLFQVSPDLRAALAQMKTPKAVELKWDTVDDWLRSLAHGLTNLITRLSLQPRRLADTMQKEVDLLAGSLLAVQRKRRHMAALEMVARATDRANEIAASALEKGSDKASNFLLAKANGNRGTLVGKSAAVASYIASLGSTDAATRAGDSLTTMMNQVEGYQALRSALSDLRGMTESNAPLLRLINPVKNAIDKLRQEFRDQVPGELARVFKKEPTREEWSRLWKGLGKTDLLALGFDDALALIKEPAQLEPRGADQWLEGLHPVRGSGRGLAGGLR